MQIGHDPRNDRSRSPEYAELEAARKEQKKADEKEQEEQQVSAAEQMAEYNAKMRRINEYLLEITVPAPVTAGQILDDVV